MHRFGVAVLRVLNEKDHQKSDDVRGSVNDELPGIRKVKDRACRDPDDDDEESSGKSPSAPEDDGGLACESAEGISGHAKEVSLFFVLF